MTRVCMLGYFIIDMDDRVKRYVETLGKIGITADVLCLQASGKTAETDEPDGRKVFRIALPNISQNKVGYLLQYGLTFLLFSYHLLRLTLKRHYDVIHVHNMPDFLVFTAFIPKILGAKLILDIHDPMPEAYMSKFGENARGVKIMALQEKFSAKFADAVITANKNFKKNLVKRGIPEKKVTVINNYPDLKIFDRSRYTRENDHQNFTLIFPGTIEPRYGLEVAIRAMPLIKNKIENVRLLIIGRRREHVNVLTALAEQLGISSSVGFKNAIPYEEVPQQLANADVGIYTAIPDPHMSVATPTKVLEYAAMGLPIVSSRLEIIEDLFPDSSVLFFEPGNPQQFADCVVKLYSDPSLFEQMGNNAQQLFNTKFVWKEEQKIYLELVDRLLGGANTKNVSGFSATAGTSQRNQP